MQTINVKELITSARPPLPVKPGLEYYRRRAADYALRHVDSRRLPPNYYLDYGDKYARRFTQQLRPKLSASGQAWIDHF